MGHLQDYKPNVDRRGLHQRFARQRGARAPTDFKSRPTAEQGAARTLLSGPKPVDIARVILFLCSDDAKVVHGATVPVYGDS